MASLISVVVPVLFLIDSLKALTSSGAVLISASHEAIWFLPKIAPAALICSCSVSFAKASCKLFWIVTLSFMLPSSFQISLIAMPYSSIAFLACLVGSASLAIPVLSEFAATFASIPAFAITPIYNAASSTSFPAVAKIGAATLIASLNELTSSAELLHAAANTSAYFSAWSKVSPKPLIVAVSPAETVSRSPASPAARFIAGASAAAASSAVSPARAKLSVAVAASFMPNVEFAAAFSIASLIKFACSSVLPIVAFVSCIVLSTSAKELTAFVPAATIGTVSVVVSPVPTWAILSPTSFTFCPTSFILSPTAFATCVPTEPKFFACFSSPSSATVSKSICVFKSLNSCDVSSTPASLRRCNASSSCFTFSRVCSTAVFNSICLSFKRLTFVGSSFKALLISRKLVLVLPMAVFTE